MSPFIRRQYLKLTEVSFVKDAKLETFPVVVGEECISVYMDNFPGSSVVALRQTVTFIVTGQPKTTTMLNPQPIFAPHPLAQH